LFLGLKQLSYAPLNEVHTILSHVLDYLTSDCM